MGKITISDLKKARKAVEKDSKFGDYIATEKNIYAKFKLNNDPALVALKIAYIDHTNSTNLRMNKLLPITMLAKEITKLNFDNRVKKGDLSLVQDIADIGNIKMLSFASKYCTYHNTQAYNRDDYSIYDSVVRSVLPSLLNEIGVNIKKSELSNYYKYCGAIDLLIRHYQLDKIDKPRRNLDWYIWWKYRSF